MLCFIDFDGTTVLKWHFSLHEIIIEDGRVIPDGHHERRIFEGHPDQNDKIEKLGGIYHYRGKSLRDPLRMNTQWGRVDGAEE